MKQFKLKVSEEIAQAFCEFAEEHDITPNEALETLVNLYGTVQIDLEKTTKAKLTGDEAFIESDKIVSGFLHLGDHMMTALPYPLFLQVEGELVKCLGVKVEDM